MPDLTTEPESFDMSPASVFDAFKDVDFAETLDEEATAAATTQADEEPAADDGDDDTTPEATPGHNPDGPGNIKAALREAREQVKAHKAALDATNARLAAIEQDRQQQAMAQQQAQQRHLLEQNIANMDPADVPGYVQAFQQQQAQQFQQQVAHEQAWSRLKDSEEAARLSLPDYDAQINKLTGVFGVHAVADWARQQPGSPAIAAYQAAKGLFTQADIDAAEARGRQTALAENAPRGLRNPSKPTPSAPRLANIPSAGTVTTPDPAARFNKQLAKGGDVTRTVSEMFTKAFGG